MCILMIPVNAELSHESKFDFKQTHLKFSALVNIAFCCKKMHRNLGISHKASVSDLHPSNPIPPLLHSWEEEPLQFHRSSGSY